ncbi:hypothetical protein Metig_0947 [Methanotorris igneus Kol 5]|uniref:Uncharacterized protein n=1 Tax=Methanotorris igneus (strain DSM 5666 / JCM 11834 / Kol 5) TaxID=880724 RepID=F6BDC9_METIK|nr:hypothetical protein Metig_0947 [Methanotorris igneus Kol 5]
MHVYDEKVYVYYVDRLITYNDLFVFGNKVFELLIH